MTTKKEGEKNLVLFGQPAELIQSFSSLLCLFLVPHLAFKFLKVSLVGKAGDTSSNEKHVDLVSNDGIFLACSAAEIVH